MEDSSQTQPPRHVWPWFVLGFLLLGVLLAVLGVRSEARRTKERREFYIQENAPSSSSPATNIPAR